MDKQILDGRPFRAKEISWLSFNSRVLEEAEDSSVPLMERIRFLGIYSSNLDEFFRVRVATLRRLARLGESYKKLNIPDPTETLFEVHEILVKEAKRFNRAYDGVLEALGRKDIMVVDELSVPLEQRDHLMRYFLSEVRPHLMPILLKGTSDLSTLRDHPMYLAVEMGKKSGVGRPGHALIEIPSDILPRFHVLPKLKKTRMVMYLDDIIRFGLPTVFRSMPYDSFAAYAIKFTRDSELEFDDDFTESFLERMSEGLRARVTGSPVRMNYDAAMPEPFLKLLRNKLNFSQLDSLYPGARYHNRKGLQDFPRMGRSSLCWGKLEPIEHPYLELGQQKGGTFKTLQKREVLLHLPYHSFNYFLDFLREAALDPLVKSIALTQYRFAKDSCVAAALLAAVRNGKRVMVLVEPQARFDEEANLSWAAVYREAGVKVIVGLPGLKVHAKMCVVERTEGARSRTYSAIGTGNFNESTAKLYTDHLLLTADPEIGKDVLKSFRYFATPTRELKLAKLVACPFGLRELFQESIAHEIGLAEKGEKGEIFLKLNNLADPEIVGLLDKAAHAGVKVHLIVRSMYSLVAEGKVRKNLKAVGIVDRYLEHSRIFIFGNAGKPQYYLSSADLLPRNLDSRFEIVCPVEDPKLQRELSTYMHLQWKDDVKARVLDKKLSNPPRKRGKKARATRAQATIREWLAGL